MIIQENIQLQSLNTMATPAFARWLVVVQSEGDIVKALQFCRQEKCDFIVLGEGSNMLFTGNLDKLIIVNRIGGAGYIDDLFASDALQVIKETNETIDLQVGAGVIWHQLVKQSIENGFSGLEQLALIPGLVGAAPIQNIGAYGSEVKDLLISVRAINTSTNEVVELDNQACEFNYRDSIFKRNPQSYIITQVVLRLNKQEKNYIFEDLYPALRNVLSNEQKMSSTVIFDTVCQLRNAKLPSPIDVPNAGSFFKNPVVSLNKKNQLVAKFPDLIYYPSGQSFKLAAGWLIERAGLKGDYRENGIGCYEKQALVLVNPKKQSGSLVIEHAKSIQESIFQKYGITLEIEPNII